MRALAILAAAILLMLPASVSATTALNCGRGNYAFGVFAEADQEGQSGFGYASDPSFDVQPFVWNMHDRTDSVWLPHGSVVRFFEHDQYGGAWFAVSAASGTRYVNFPSSWHDRVDSAAIQHCPI